MIRVLAVIDAAGNWSPGLGDNSIAGWVITLAYLGSLALCLWAWRREDARWLAGTRGLRPRFWLAMAAAMLLLGLNKQLDLQTLVSVVGRRAAKSMGWYDQRRTVQSAFIAIVALIAVTAVVGVAWWVRSAWRRYWLAAIGAAYLGVFIVLRAASFHHVDSVLYRLPGIGMYANRALELTGILLIAWTAWRVARSGPKGAGSRAGST